MAQTTRIIKKYPNRRLYDTEISSYITLEEVRQLVMDGETFEVRDAKSGEDLTRSVLLQIISEHEDRAADALAAVAEPDHSFLRRLPARVHGAVSGAQPAGVPRPAAAVPYPA